MRLFLKRLLLLLGLFILLMAAILSFQLYYMNKLWKIIPQEEPVLARNLDTKTAAKSINILGCSNLEFNIDIEAVRRNFPDVAINKYNFAGALNSAYMKYMVANIRAANPNAKFVVYLPTNLFFKENTFPHHPHFYQFGISKNFLKFMIRENPMILVSENWRDVYQKASQHQFGNYQSLFRDGRADRELDSLCRSSTPFSNCNLAFDRSKHHIKRPDLTEQDAAYFNSIFGKENYSIINSPIPNLPDHKKYDYSIFEKVGYNKPLDRVDRVVYDSTLFYDQWYHLNKCGRDLETGKFIGLLKKVL